MEVEIGRLSADLAAREAEVERLRLRNPTIDEMERLLGERNEGFLDGTIRRCRVCRIPVFGGPTACVICVEREERDRRIAKLEAALRRLKFLIDADIEEGTRWDRITAIIDAALSPAPSPPVQAHPAPGPDEQTCSICNKMFSQCACSPEAQTQAWRDWYQSATVPAPSPPGQAEPDNGIVQMRSGETDVAEWATKKAAE